MSTSILKDLKHLCGFINIRISGIISLTSFLIILFPIIYSAQEIIDSSELSGKLVINYAVNDYILTLTQKTQIDDFLSTHQFSDNFIVSGHTDTDGTEIFNQMLSEKRSSELYNYLLRKGIKKDIMQIKSHGETRTLYDEQSEESKAANRRVDLEAYRTKVYIPFSGRIVRADTTNSIKAEIKVYRKDKLETIQTDSLGEFSIPIPIDERTELYYKAMGFFPVREVLKLNERSKPQGIIIKMREMKQGAVLESSLRFHGGQSILLEQSAKELQVLKEVLMENQDLCFEIRGHINTENSTPLPKASFSYGLSIARSIEIYNYLLDAGVPIERMLARGYGNEELKYHYARSYEKQSANRRVEFKVTSCDSTSILENDNVEDLEQYRISGPQEKLFNELTYHEDMKTFKTHVQRQIIFQVKYLKEKRRDPARYTYLDLLRMYQKRQKGEPDD